MNDTTPTVHKLKTWPAFFRRVASGEKTFEIRKDDRGFQKGDVLLLQEWDPKHLEIGGPANPYTGEALRCEVTYVTGWEQKPGFVVMAIKPVGDTARITESTED